MIKQKTTDTPKCIVCGALIIDTTYRQFKKYCSSRCRTRGWERKQSGYPISDNEYFKGWDLPCKNCGKPFLYIPTGNGGIARKFCSEKCRLETYKGKYATRYHTKIKNIGRQRLADIWTNGIIKCHNCSITDIDLLDFGHPLNNGRKHMHIINSTGAKSTTQMCVWIKNATDNKIREICVKNECAFCNQFYARKGHYPTIEERKQWSKE